MEDIYANVEYDKKPSTNLPGPSSSKRSCHAVGICLGLLSVFLLAGLIGLGVTYAKLDTVKANLTERLQISDNKLSTLTEERALLKANLTETTEELNRLKNPCPKEWTPFRQGCYFISTESGSWEKGKENCTNRGADLVVIKSTEEQTFLTIMIKQDTWIGLSDRDTEGTWKWTDGSSLTQSHWRESQPDNGNGNSKYGEEDCAYLQANIKSLANWNDRNCGSTLKWVCEKMA